MLLNFLLALLTRFSLAGAATFQLILDDPDPTACETPTTTSVVPTSTSVLTTTSLPPLVPTPVPSPPGTPKCSSCPELDTNLCPPPGTLGIRYGRCYTMTDLDGRQFTRATLKDYTRYYYIGGNGLYKNIPFRVCANSTNCDLSQDNYVPEAGKWYLQDQLGSEEIWTADFVGVNTGSPGAGNWWLYQTDSTTTDYSTLIVSFTAKLNCLFGKCTPCVRLERNASRSLPGKLGIMRRFEVGTGASLGESIVMVSNNNTCLPIIFQETKCVARP